MPAFPRRRVLIDHIARIGVGGTIRDEDMVALCALSQHPHAYLKVGAFYALGREGPLPRPGPADPPRGAGVRLATLFVGDRLPVPDRQRHL